MATINPPLTTVEQQQMLEQLRRARSAHLRWRAYAQALVSGYDIEEGQLPLAHTDCQFGHWYYGTGQQLQHLEAFRAIEPPHQQLHATYQQIYRLVTRQRDPDLLQHLRTFLGYDRYEQSTDQLMAELKACSENMLVALERLEHDLSHYP